MKYSVLILCILLAAVVFAVVKTEREENQKLPEVTVVDGVTVETKDQLKAAVATTQFTAASPINGKTLQLAYPVTAEVNEKDGLIEISFFGLNNTLDTEITDGYKLIITHNPNISVTNFLVAQQAASAVQPTQVAGRDGYTYVSNPVAGQQLEEHVIFQEGSSVIEVTYFVAGPTKSTYRELVWDIVASIGLVE